MAQNKLLIANILADYQASVARIVLFSVGEAPFPLGVKKTIDVLKGNRSSFFLNNELHLMQTFSALTGLTRDQLSDIIDVLILQGLIQIQTISEDGEDYTVLQLSKVGQSFLSHSRESVFDLLPILMDMDVPDIPEDDQDLYYKLKLARRQLAEEYDVPAHLICSDGILRGMCLRKPLENDELERIKGISREFMQLYSKQFLYVIRQYTTREKGS